MLDFIKEQILFEKAIPKTRLRKVKIQEMGKDQAGRYYTYSNISI